MKSIEGLDDNSPFNQPEIYKGYAEFELAVIHHYQLTREWELPQLFNRLRRGNDPYGVAPFANMKSWFTTRTSVSTVTRERLLNISESAWQTFASKHTPLLSDTMGLRREAWHHLMRHAAELLESPPGKTEAQCLVSLFICRCNKSLNAGQAVLD